MESDAHATPLPPLLPAVNYQQYNHGQHHGKGELQNSSEKDKR